jgi:hypothetical protein
MWQSQVLCCSRVQAVCLWAGHCNSLPPGNAGCWSHACYPHHHDAMALHHSTVVTQPASAPCCLSTDLPAPSALAACTESTWLYANGQGRFEGPAGAGLFCGGSGGAGSAATGSYQWASGGGGVGLFGPATQGPAPTSSSNPFGRGGSFGADANSTNGADYGAGAGGQLLQAGATISPRPGPARGGKGACRVFYGPNKRWDLVGLTLPTPPDTFPVGEATFDAPGTYTWVAPPGVTFVAAACVGGGGGAGAYDPATGLGSASGGGGGALNVRDRIPVVPGQSYPVVVGAGGVGPGANGSASTFINASVLLAEGGQGGALAGGAGGVTPYGGIPGGVWTTGGRGGDMSWDGASGKDVAGGGGGAGGYNPGIVMPYAGEACLEGRRGQERRLKVQCS